MRPNDESEKKAILVSGRTKMRHFPSTPGALSVLVARYAFALLVVLKIADKCLAVQDTNHRLNITRPNTNIQK